MSDTENRGRVSVKSTDASGKHTAGAEAGLTSKQGKKAYENIKGGWKKHQVTVRAMCRGPVTSTALNWGASLYRIIEPTAARDRRH